MPCTEIESYITDKFTIRSCSCEVVSFFAVHTDE